jgi:hypothetical protein
METVPVKPAASSSAFFSKMTHPVKFPLFLLAKLPAAYFAGLRVVAADEDSCTVSVPYKWFTQNPFRSTYFACLSMAAELSTGALAMAAIHGQRPGFSMLITAMEARFLKKATGKTYFTCAAGEAIREVVERARSTGAGEELPVRSTGRNAAGEIVAEFVFTWIT